MLVLANDIFAVLSCVMSWESEIRICDDDDDDDDDAMSSHRLFYSSIHHNLQENLQENVRITLRDFQI